MDTYGKEVVLDLHDCDVSQFNRKKLRKYFKEICILINMQRCKLVFWDDIGVLEEEKQILPHTTGTSAVQFILTSSIVIHTLDVLGKVFINVFSCKDFDPDVVKTFTENFFNGKIANSVFIDRL